MNTFNTRNPLGSTAVKDLYDNAEVFDRLVNSDQEEVQGRLGKRLKTWEGIQKDWAQFLIESGYVSIGNYDEGPLTITKPNQTFVKDGAYWRPSASLELPYTTVEDWGIDESNFVAIDDGALRQELASDDPAMGASLVNFTQPDAGAHARDLASRARDVVNVLDFIPPSLHAGIKDGSIRGAGIDLRPYIQAALDAARGPGAITRMRLRRVFAPSGFYPTGTIYVPEGVVLQGSGACETTSANATQFIQFANNDVIRFAGHFSGDRDWWFGRLQDFTVYGRLDSNNKQVATAGYGIQFRNAAGIEVTPQDTTCIRDVIVRFCKQGGIRMPFGGLPLDIATVKIKDCDGPGISITGGAGSIQSIILYQPSIDRCGSEAILIENHDNRGQITIIGGKFEGGTNPNLPTPAMRQRVGVRIRNCDNGAPIQIIGATHIMGAGDSVKPGDFIVVEGDGIPHLEWSGVQVRIASNQTGGVEPRVASAEGVAIPKDVKTGSLSNMEYVDRSTTTARRHVLGNVDSYTGRTVEGTAFQVAGETPALSLYETDAPTDAKNWLMVASGGVLSLRSTTESGDNNIWLQANRSGGMVAKVEINCPVRLGTYTKSTLPPALSMANCMTMVSDPSAGKGRAAYSNGVEWRYISDDTVV